MLINWLIDRRQNKHQELICWLTDRLIDCLTNSLSVPAVHYEKICLISWLLERNLDDFRIKIRWQVDQPYEWHPFPRQPASPYLTGDRDAWHGRPTTTLAPANKCQGITAFIKGAVAGRKNTHHLCINFGCVAKTPRLPGDTGEEWALRWGSRRREKFANAAGKSTDWTDA